MVVQNNIPALNSHRNLAINNSNVARNLEKLSSGFRINRAGDDAAGLAISERMRGQIRGLGMAMQNTENGISLIKTAEGGLNETHAILHRMRELAVQSANGTFQDVDREQINLEVQSLMDEINRISAATHYNGIQLLDGTLGSIRVDDLQSADTRNAINTFLGAIELGEHFASDLHENVRLISTNFDPSAAIDPFLDSPFRVALQVGDRTYMLSEIEVSGTAQFAFVNNTGDVVATLDSVIDNNWMVDNFAEYIGVGVVHDIHIRPDATSGDNMLHANEARFAARGASASNLIFQIGANGGLDQRTVLRIDNMSSAALGGRLLISDLHHNVSGASVGDFAFMTVSQINITSRDGANDAIAVIDMAVDQISDQRAQLGAMQNRLEHTLNNLGVTRENLTAAESTIRDVDMASEMMMFTRNNILVQASQAMLAQANQLPQGVLQLLN